MFSARYAGVQHRIFDIGILNYTYSGAFQAFAGFESIISGDLFGRCSHSSLVALVPIVHLMQRLGCRLSGNQGIPFPSSDALSDAKETGSPAASYVEPATQADEEVI